MLDAGAGVNDGDGHAGATGQLPGVGQVEHTPGRDRPLLAFARVRRRPRRRGDSRSRGRRPIARQVGQLADAELPRHLALHGEAVAVLRGRAPQRRGAEARERAPQRRAAQVAEQRPRVAGPHVDPAGAERLHRLRPQTAHGTDADAEPGAAQRLGVQVGQRLVLVERLVADHDPRPAARPSRPAEPVGVDELAADRLRQSPVDHALVEAPQLQRGQQPGCVVQTPPQRRAIAAQHAAAHDRDDVIGADHVPVVAQGEDVRPRQLRVGRERQGDLGAPVVEGLQPGVGDRQPHIERGRIDAIDALEAGDAVGVHRTARRSGKAHTRRLRTSVPDPDQRHQHPYARGDTGHTSHASPPARRRLSNR